MNNVYSLYGTNEVWNDIAGRFLDGSNKISDILIPDINYLNSNLQKSDTGYYGALVNAVGKGISKINLNALMLKEWKKLILDEMQKHGVIKDHQVNLDSDFQQMEPWLKTINEKLKKLEAHFAEAEIVSLLADVSCEIESNKLFFPIQRRIAHLLHSYITSYLKQPLLVFTQGEKTNYIASVDNIFKMRILLAEKIREAVFYRGLLLKKVGGEYASDWYKIPGSKSKKDLILEWHALFDAIKQWEEQLANTH